MALALILYILFLWGVYKREAAFNGSQLLQNGYNHVLQSSDGTS